MSQVGGVGSSPTPDPKPLYKDKNLAPEILESAVAEDVPVTPKSARLIPPTNEMSKSIQNLALPFSPGNSTRTIRLFDDNDELSEISEFEPDNNTANERAAIGVSAPCDHELKPTQQKIDRMRMKGSSSATSKEIKKSSGSTSITADCAEGIAQRSPEIGKPLSTSDSPTFGSSSSTQIDVSPKLLSNADVRLTVGTEVVDGLSLVSQDILGADRTGVDERGPSDTELIIALAGKPQIGFSSAEDELGQHARRFTHSSGADQKVRSRIEITKDTSLPPKIAGSRRKREPIKTSSKALVEVNDESTPPRKKSRDDRLGVEEDKVKSNETSLDAIPISRVKRYTKTAKRTSPVIDPTAADFDELPEPKPTCQGTRRSSRIKKRQTAATGGTRANAIRGKIQKEKQADGQSACGVKPKKLSTVSLQATSFKTSHGAPMILSFRSVVPVTRESPFPKISDQVVSNATFAISHDVELDICYSTAFGGAEQCRKYHSRDGPTSRNVEGQLFGSAFDVIKCCL